MSPVMSPVTSPVTSHVVESSLSCLIDWLIIYCSVLRRSLSEGSLLREPPSPHFLSESAIHRLTHPVTSDPDPLPTSPCTLRKQLTSEGGSLHQILLLLNSTKVECQSVGLVQEHNRPGVSFITVTKQGLKRAHATSHANVGFYKNDLDGKMCTFPCMRMNMQDVRWWTEADYWSSSSCACAPNLFHTNLLIAKYIKQLTANYVQMIINSGVINSF